MKAEFIRAPMGRIKDGLLCVFALQDGELPAELGAFKAEAKKHIKRTEGHFFACTMGAAAFEHLLVVNLGKKDKLTIESLRKGAGAAARHAAMLKQKSFTMYAPSLEGVDPPAAAQAITEGALLSGHRFHSYKSKKDGLFRLERVRIASMNDLSGGVEKGRILADAQNYAREMDEPPANMATPGNIAKQAKGLAKEKRLVITIYDEKALRRMGMNAILAVARGSGEPPLMVRLEYNKGKRHPLYCLVGKGITFDSGGLSLKPSKNMHEMKYDKTGAIDVIAVMKAIAELGLPIRVIALLPFTENVPSGRSQKPGDIIKSYNGKTIEVLNTDAEGRLILADALSFAAEQKPEAIIDVATLTGAAVVALGRHAIGLFSNDDKLAHEIEQSGLQTHERVWRMPLWEEYGEMMKSDLADLKNISELPEAGCITAAAFLQEFVGESRWAHLDIAAVDHVSSSHPYLDKGASGIGVRLITETLIRLSKKK